MQLTVQELIDRLRTEYRPTQTLVAQVWSVGDIQIANQAVFEEEGQGLSEDRLLWLWHNKLSNYIEQYLGIVASELNDEIRFQTEIETGVQK